MLETSTGQDALLRYAIKGTLIVGDGIAPLANDSWFLVNATAAVSALPVAAGYFFKSPDALNAITPAIGDDVYPLTFQTLCKVSVNFDDAKGEVDTTDDCGAKVIPDGIVTISGSFTGFEKHNEPTGGLSSAQLSIKQRFWNYTHDDGAGTYTFTAKNDDELILFVFVNKNKTAATEIQTWRIISVMLGSSKWTGDNKSGQAFECSFKQTGTDQIYERITNGSETVII